MTDWSRRPISNAGQKITIRNDCTGVPYGCVELWVQDDSIRTGSALDLPLWVQVHMTPVLARSLRAALGRAIAEIESGDQP